MLLLSFTQDPYILRNHLGSLECRLCLTLHTNEGSYLAHTQGKKHQTNLARRAARDLKDTQLLVAPAPSNVQRKQFVKIGRPGYRVTKVRERIEYDAMGNIVMPGGIGAVSSSAREGMMVQVYLPQIKEGVLPRKRFMSAWEQKKEQPNRAYQYLIVSMTFCVPESLRFLMLTLHIYVQVAAEPYETIAFRIPAREIEDESDDDDLWNWSHWDPDTKQYSFQFMFR